jgi:protease IV
MAKFLIGLVAGALLMFLAFILLFVALVRFREQPPVVAAKSVLVLRLSGDIPEKPPVELPSLLGGGGPGATVSLLWLNLKKAAADANIRAVVVEPSGVSAGWAKLEEIRADLEQFRKSGKPVYAYLRSPSARDYYVALGADRIYLGPQEPLMLKGLRAEMLYFKNTLDKLGVSVEVEHAGEYKDFGDMFTRSSMSPETREVINSVVDGLYGSLVTRIAAARKKTPEQVRAIIDRGPFTASRALAEGLVDELRFEDQLWGELKTKLGGEPVRVPLERYARVPAPAAKHTIALVIGEGDILRGSAGDNGSDETSLTSFGFNKLLENVASNSLVKGMIVRISSPGGESTASDELWRQMNLVSRKRPMVISMSDVAASGGYYMAMTGDPIVAYPETETGSIGVVFGKPNLRGLYAKLGISKDAIERGRNADIDSDYTPLTTGQRTKLKEGIDESYHDFVGKVAEARKRPFEEMERVARGRVWLGSQARERGLVDELGGLDKALELIRKKANIPAGDTVNVAVYPGRRSLLDLLVRRSQEDMLETRLREVFGRVPFHAWMKGGLLRVMPYGLQIQ